MGKKTRQKKTVDTNCLKLLLAEDAEGWSLYVVFLCLENDEHPDHQQHNKNVKHNGNNSQHFIELAFFSTSCHFAFLYRSHIWVFKKVCRCFKWFKRPNVEKGLHWNTLDKNILNLQAVLCFPKSWNKWQWTVSQTGSHYDFSWGLFSFFLKCFLMTPPCTRRWLHPRDWLVAGTPRKKFPQCQGLPVVAVCMIISARMQHRETQWRSG